MNFTSSAFLFVFLPIFLIVFRCVVSSQRLSVAAKLTIFIGTLIFYGMERSIYILPFLVATSMDLMWSNLLLVVRNSNGRKLIVFGSVVQNLVLFFLFKYLEWLYGEFPNSPTLASLHHWMAGDGKTIELPPGLSFYLFESLSFVIDCYRGTVLPPRNPLNFFTFIAMFPRFVAGPIVRYRDLIDSIENYKGPRFAEGVSVFMLGFWIKILFADSCEKFVGPIFGRVLEMPASLFSVLAYSLQIYLDFSGYSKMAIGLGLMLGFPFPDNFAEPYHSSSITEFWRRWHISLSTWLRDYLYIPLGGNRQGVFRSRLNLLITMALGGLWHGANITFVIWGVYHGLLLIFDKILFKGLQSKLLTVILVALGWVWFRASDTREAGRVFGGMIGIHGTSPATLLNHFYVKPTYLVLLVLGLFWIIWLEPKLRIHRGNRPWASFELTDVCSSLLIVNIFLFLIATGWMMSSKIIPFLYFQF